MREIAKHWIEFILILFLSVTVFSLFTQYSACIPLVLTVSLPIVTGILLVIQAIGIDGVINTQKLTGKDEIKKIRITFNNKSLFSVMDAVMILKIKYYLDKRYISCKENISFLAGKKTGFSIEAPLSHYGIYYCSCGKLRLYDIFRIWFVNKRIRNCGYIDVIPTIDVDKTVMANKIEDECDGEECENFSVNGNDVTQYDVREYRPGDAVKNIHWKLSARNDNLIVKEFGEVEAKVICIYITDIVNKSLDELDILYEKLYRIAYDKVKNDERIVLWPSLNVVENCNRLDKEMHDLYLYVGECRSGLREEIIPKDMDMRLLEVKQDD